MATKKKRKKKQCSRWGKLKNPRGRRVCRRGPARGGKARRRSSSGRRAKGRCPYGFKKGTRVCRRTRVVRKQGRAAQEAAMWRAFKAGRL